MIVGIIGYGLQGQRREQALPPEDEIYVSDPNVNDVPADYAIRHSDYVIISTPNNLLARYATMAAELDRPFLLEKPGARSVKELEGIPTSADCTVAYTLRHHPAMVKAKELLPSLGEILHIRAHYGHGGRPGYEKEWRMNPDISGGGQLIDQGSHLIDLVYWFTGFDKFDTINANLRREYWDCKGEDNAFVSLGYDKFVAWLHTSCTEWKNSFGFEIFCKEGKVAITGLGGSYGPETITVCKPDGTPLLEQQFDTTYIWEDEWQAFLDCHGATLQDAKKVLEVTDYIYRFSTDKSH